MLGPNRVIVAAALLVIPVVLSHSTSTAAQEIVLRGATKVAFATQGEAAALLTQKDDFVSRLSAFDRSARLKSEQAIDEATYLKFVAQHTLDWTSDEKAAIATAFANIDGELSKLKMQLPQTITMIKTSGAEEGNAAYTRGSSIVVPQSKLKNAAGAGLAALMAHELFHVLSRHDVQLRERLYKSIGFQRCAELKLPDDLAGRRLTNPDAPINDHYIQLKIDGQEVAAIPVLYANTDHYDKQRGGEFFNYLVFEFIAIELEGSSKPSIARPMLKDGMPYLIKPGQAGGFIDQVGRNTQYLIHPDEILADNFMLMVTRSDNIKSPEVAARIAACFQE